MVLTQGMTHAGRVPTRARRAKPMWLHVSRLGTPSIERSVKWNPSSKLRALKGKKVPPVLGIPWVGLPAVASKMSPQLTQARVVKLTRTGHSRSAPMQETAGFLTSWALQAAERKLCITGALRQEVNTVWLLQAACNKETLEGLSLGPVSPVSPTHAKLYNAQVCTRSRRGFGFAVRSAMILSLPCSNLGAW